MAAKLKPSEEQTEIIKTIQTHNVVVDSVAGSGKSSCILFIAETYPDLSILVLTYNAQLKSETRKRSVHLKNISVHSYHSFCVSNYDPLAYTDDGINTIIVGNVQPKEEISYDIIVADEAQDITPLLFKLICKIISDNKKKDCKIAVIGDQMQSIYKFRDSDCRYITMATQIFKKFNTSPWAELSLSQSFRCTDTMAFFINECMIGYSRLKSKKSSLYRPDYVICNSYGITPRRILDKYLKSYKPQDIFILAFSVKDKTPTKNLANYITNNTDIPIFCSSSDQESLDPRVIENKLVFTTIHQAKGRERKVVLFLGFDEGYFEYYDTKADKSICPNELYVAVTRGSERLTVIHDQKKNYLPFLNVSKLRTATNFTDESKDNVIKKGITFEDNSFTVSELVSYLPFSIEKLCENCLTIKQVREAEYKLDIENVVKMDNDCYESVSEITGIAIPAYFEYKINGTSTIVSKNLVDSNISRLQEECENGNSKELNSTKLATITKLKKFSKTLKNYYTKVIKSIDIANLTVADILKISLYYSAQQNKTEYKLKQVTNFDWLTEFMLSEGTNRMNNEIPKTNDLIFEESVERSYCGNLILGEIDCIDKTRKIVYEFKCTKDLTISHIIQLGIYMYLYPKESYKYRLFNIFTNEVKELSATPQDLEKMIKILIEYKLSNHTKKTDDEFLNQLDEIN